MTAALNLKPQHKVLEIGTGSGYQAAILGELAGAVYSIEIVESLGREAARRLKRLGYKNVHVKLGDGYQGWPEYAPFDAVIVTCAPDHIPQPLVDQLKVGGLMMIPVGGDLIFVRRTPEGMAREKKMDVRFVPMTGEARSQRGGINE
ncbi:MAG: methyltransferase domain-containing protein, partial [Elusimicrobiota bacterium]